MRNNTIRVFVSFAVLFSVSMAAVGQSKGFDPSRMDRSAKACDDFFQYSNGAWVEATQIPASESRWGSFNILAQNNRQILKGVLEEASESSPAEGTDMQLIGDFYYSCMNVDEIEKEGMNPVRPILGQIDRIRNRTDLQDMIAKMHNMGLPAVFVFFGGTDLKESTMTIANAGQGGLSMPNRDYYVGGDPKLQKTREEFRKYAAKIFMLAGDSEQEARDNVFTVVRVQNRLAYASLRRVELRNPDNRYKKISLEEAEKITPHFSWKRYMQNRGISPVKAFNIGQPEFFEAVDSLIANTSIREWKTYLRWMTLNRAAPVLSSDFADANFDFYSRHLRGIKEQEPRWRRCVTMTDGSIGEALGQEYVKKAFRPEAKQRMEELIDNLFSAFRARLDSLEWMSDDTKVQALAKLATFKRKIGYPDKLRGYKGLKIGREAFFENIKRASELEIQRDLEEIGKPVDRSRWAMTPPTVNAYYHPLLNEIVFPAGILQPPFFDAEADDAINYGAIGAVIGHEITHGFDDQGSRFDAEGNFKSWWTKEDREKFDDRASCVAKQFSSYEVQPDLFMDGKLTLGENIADLGGLTVAYDAFKKSLEGKPEPQPIDGFTPEQRFFLGWAQVWAVKATQEFERLQVTTDSHAIARWRVNGPMSNMPQFSTAFGCKQTEPMVRKTMCSIW